MEINLEKFQEKKSWKHKIINEKIEALDVYWFDTFNSENRDTPVYVKAIIMQRFYQVHGRLPRWNKEF